MPFACCLCILQGSLCKGFQGMVRGWMVIAPTLSWSPLGNVTGQDPWTPHAPFFMLQLGRGSPERAGPSHLYTQIGAFVGSSSIPVVLNLSYISESSRSKWTLLTREDICFHSITQKELPLDPSQAKSWVWGELNRSVKSRIAHGEAGLSPVPPTSKYQSISPAIT